MTDPTERRWSSPVTGIGMTAFGARPAARLVEVALGVALALASTVSGRGHVLGLVAIGVAALAWLGWIAAGDDRRRSLGALTALSAAGGVCAAVEPNGGIFVFVAAAATAFGADLPAAIAVLAPALATFIAVGADVTSLPGHLVPVVVAGLLGIVVGGTRRQLVERSRQATLLATAERRAALAEREAQLGAERNRLGRDIHDLLAHTMGTVSIQLTALESRLDAGDPPDALRSRVRDLHDLVGDGLVEARDAVRALKGDHLPLDAQITRLGRLHGAEVRIEGPSRPLGPDAALALYRVAQEALTNAAKHAPGAPVALTLDHRAGGAQVTVRNGAGRDPALPLASSGGGQGLTGMRTRVELAGGTCSAGPESGGWVVTATFPPT